MKDKTHSKLVKENKMSIFFLTIQDTRHLKEIAKLLKIVQDRELHK
jgi:hypothetical protein